MHRFSRSNPHLIYLIFTTSIAHLSGIRAFRTSSSQAANSTQLSLVSCVDALKDMALTWPLAERCHRIMLGLMNDEGIVPGGSSPQSGYSGYDMLAGRPPMNHSGPSTFAAPNVPASQYHQTLSCPSTQGGIIPQSSMTSITAPYSPSSPPDSRRRRRVDEGSSESNKRQRSISGPTAPSLDVSSPTSAVRSDHSRNSPAFFSVPSQGSSGSTPITQSYMTAWDRALASGTVERTEAVEAGHNAATTQFKSVGFEGCTPDFDALSGTGWTAPGLNPESGQLDPSSFANPRE